MSVVIIPYGTPRKHLARLGRMPLDGLAVMGDVGQAKTVADLPPESHLLMMTSSKSITANLMDVRCRTSIILLEPPAIQMRYYLLLALSGRRYHAVFTYAETLLRTLRNARYLSHGGASVAAINGQPEKTKQVSLIASDKKTTRGHKLRHRIAQWSRACMPELELFGRGYQPVESVATALTSFRYSVVIENSQYPGYFTEKLIDCMLCRAVPIYWGDPTILSRFDSAGMVQCDSEDDLRSAIAACTQEGYQMRLDAIEENYRRALHFAESPVVRAAQSLGMID